VQLLAARGVTVVATATPRDIERLKGLGATTVVDYTTGDLSGQVRAVHPEGVDAVIDLVSHTPDGLPVDLIRKGGKVASTRQAADPQILDADGLTGINVNGGPVREVIAVLAEQVAAGTLKVDVNTVLPLEQAADGLATLASRTARGKIVIKIAD
jgi:NADPH:quinone reductase-like Zn-dependent oxidoreductase